MVCLKNWKKQTVGEDVDLHSLEIGEEMMIAENSDFRLSGKIYGSTAYLDGTLILTSPIVCIRKEDDDLCVAVTSKGKEYAFNLVMHYGIPTLNQWSFKDEYIGALWYDKAALKNDRITFSSHVTIC